MRTSCNGCRVLRKGCSEDCNIRPCLQWIKSPESQANVTVFLAKFYGRAGLINLINAGPDHLRPAIFKSLLYEACGRIVDPIHGSVGLLWSGNWNHCQAAVDAVLNGVPIMQLHPNSDASASHLIIPTPPLNASYDIRHVAFKEEDTNSVSAAAASSDFQKMKKIRTRSKRTRSKAAAAEGVVDQDQDESMFSVETVEASLVNGVNNNNPDPILKYGGGGVDDQNGDSEIGLELSLGLPPYMGRGRGRGRGRALPIINGSGDDKMDVGV